MPQVSGKVDALHFADGADLKAGQILFTIDVRPFEATLHQVEAQLAKDQAVSANAERMRGVIKVVGGVSLFGGQISDAPRDYVVVGLGCGGHFDFFGK